MFDERDNDFHLWDELCHVLSRDVSGKQKKILPVLGGNKIIS